MAGHEQSAEILLQTDSVADTMHLALKDFIQGDTPGRRAAGLRNVIVWGRAVTNVLQHLRTLERESFGSWYEPWRKGLEDNPEFRYLYELRSQTLKEGQLGRTTGSVEIIEMTGEDSQRLMRNPPDGAISFFIGDSLGGSGWKVELADGTTQNYYVEIPSDIAVDVSANFAEATTQKHLPPPTRPIAAILKDYVAYLDGMIADAKREFGPT